MQKALGCHHSREDFVQLGDNLSTVDVQICFPPSLIMWDLKQCVFQKRDFLYKGNYYYCLFLLAKYDC